MYVCSCIKVHKYTHFQISLCSNIVLCMYMYMYMHTHVHACTLLLGATEAVLESDEREGGM